MLQANDKGFKEELGQLVELDVWEDATLEAAKRLREAKDSQRQIEWQLKDLRQRLSEYTVQARRLLHHSHRAHTDKGAVSGLVTRLVGWEISGILQLLQVFRMTLMLHVLGRACLPLPHRRHDCRHLAVQTACASTTKAVHMHAHGQRRAGEERGPVFFFLEAQHFYLQGSRPPMVARLISSPERACLMYELLSSRMYNAHTQVSSACIQTCR